MSLNIGINSKQQINLYIEATYCSKAPGEREIAILLNLVGEEGIEGYNMFKFKNTKYKDVIEALNSCKPLKMLFL